MLVVRTCVLLVVGLVPLSAAEKTETSDAYRYVAGEAAGGRLEYVDGVPVLVVGGTPAMIGEQTARLVGEAAEQLVDFPKRTLEARGIGDQWPRFLAGVQVFAPNVPKPYLAEIRAYSKVSGVAVDRIIAANVMPDVYRAFGCSTIIVDADRSATGGTLFARNLDFFTLGTLHRYDLVTVCRPAGKHAFVSVGFPGLVGVLSGMNEKGLTLAVHEVETSRDGSAMVNWLGVPYTMAFRRILEECETVAEANALLKGLPRTTRLNLAICDRETSGVLEITPRTVVLRSAEAGTTVCTNHFRSEELCTSKECRRFDTLSAAGTAERFDVATLQQALHAANQGETTLQSMVFEPGALVLHVSLNGLPSSRGPYRTVDVSKWLTRAEP